MSLDQSSILGLGKGRLEALTDGIFATVMTVLVLSLSVPVIASNITGSELSSDVVVDIEALWPNILGYVLSFLLLAVLWISHHSVFHYVTRLDRPPSVAEHSFPSHDRIPPVFDGSNRQVS
jgi:uncharacterized membrane protein